MNHRLDPTHLLFADRRLVIATKHKKEEAIAPVVEAALGVRCVVPDALDTDLFGTFTGDRPRTDDPRTTARKKCLSAMSVTDCDVAIASEGSFGAHPTLFFVPSDEEIVMLVDRKHDLEIVAREVSLETNFDGSELNSEEELMAFAERARFPSHGLVLRSHKDDVYDIHKGITEWDRLIEIYRAIASRHGTVYGETDMRAMYNPTRMRIIRAATERLVDTVRSCCPRCGTPGFTVTGVKRGLPCRLCGLPTRLATARISSCVRCAFTREDPLEERDADPKHCEFCNP